MKRFYLTKEQLAGLKFVENTKSTLRDSRHIIDSFTLNEKEYDIEFNGRDSVALKEQAEYLRAGKGLIKEHGGIEKIPADQIVSGGFARLLIGKKFILFKKMTEAGGAVIVREK